ncbi:kinase-like domain-containing protein [Sordaria brevicollis]|uniref:Kinase-like domain-containing protein n=1 Tax=Sordaria brevicollis TaxID=83679 RepID=A0AAE0NWB6_SORBR|nr:kinase-like domain-containing protein [Sordaria brevicollis]
MSAASREEGPLEVSVKILTKEEAANWHSERRNLYTSGKLFPIKINTEIGAKRADRIFRVINKLGYGTYGTVWLVEDTKPPANAPSRWKAIKIHRRGTADTDLLVLKEFKRADITPEKALTEYQVAIPYEQFPIKGGLDGKTIYTCSVLPLLGPKVDDMGVFDLSNLEQLGNGKDYASRFACRQIAEALQKLHKMGIAHGDFRPSNILYYLPHLDKLSENEILSVYGQPVAVALKDPVPFIEPEYLCFPARCNVKEFKMILDDKNLDMCLVGQQKEAQAGGSQQLLCATVIDLGSAWHHTWAPRHSLIPVNYQAPELIVRRHGYMSVQSDIWALGCSMVRIHTQQPAFPDDWPSVNAERPETNVLAGMEFFLGPIPVPYRNAWKERRRGKNHVFPTNPAHVGFLEYSTLKKWRKRYRKVEEDNKSPLHVAVWKSEVGRDHAEDFLDLLMGIFKWFPDQRMSLENILSHPFLQVSVSQASDAGSGSGPGGDKPGGDDSGK